MDLPAWLLVGLIAAIMVLVYLVLALKRQLELLAANQNDPTVSHWLSSMQRSLTAQDQHLTQTLQQSYSELHQRLDKATEVMQSLQKEAGAFNELGRSMRELETFLKSPKIRGGIGEEVLKDLIGQLFPKQSFHLQYAFKSGQIVDAAIKTDAGILPIDSKFPLENFQKLARAESKLEQTRARRAFVRDTKKHVKAISSKYILPSEGTMDFALMYVPSESVFYELVNEPDVLDYARRHRVYLVSPSTLYAHLQTILLSFEGQKLERRSRQIYNLLLSIQQDYTQLNDSLNLMGKHMTNAYNQLNNTHQASNTLGQRLETVRDLGTGEEDE
jgi:DNA recombination protein RmuC